MLIWDQATHLPLRPIAVLQVSLPSTPCSRIAANASGKMTKAAVSPQNEVQDAADAVPPPPPAAPDADKETDADDPPPTPKQLKFQRYLCNYPFSGRAVRVLIVLAVVMYEEVSGNSGETNAALPCCCCSCTIDGPQQDILSSRNECTTRSLTIVERGNGLWFFFAEGTCLLGF